MKEHSHIFPIEKMSKVLQVSRSGYYRWLKSGLSRRTVENRELTEEIRRIHTWSKQTYGSPRITAELNIEGKRASRPRVARLMKKAGIRSKMTKKYRVSTTDSKHGFHIASNLLDRNFTSTGSAHRKVGETGKVWVSDITYIPTVQGWLYLTTIINLEDRKVIGWALSTTMKAEDTTLAAWKMAVINRPITSELIFHSDRGVQYACTQFTELLKAYTTVKPSMSRKGNCWDNAVAESFFKSMKSEWTKWHRYQSFKQAKLSVFEYIETWYNISRRHSSLNYMTPIEYHNFLQNRNLAA